MTRADIAAANHILAWADRTSICPHPSTSIGRIIAAAQVLSAWAAEVAIAQHHQTDLDTYRLINLCGAAATILRGTLPEEGDLPQLTGEERWHPAHPATLAAMAWEAVAFALTMGRHPEHGAKTAAAILATIIGVDHMEAFARGIGLPAITQEPTTP